MENFKPKSGNEELIASLEGQVEMADVVLKRDRAMMSDSEFVRVMTMRDKARDELNLLLQGLDKKE